MTRIIGGVARGRRLVVPPRGSRPTTDRVRESLFNILAARIDFAGSAVLDLYAGSGALGLEALSRGASSALFVESDQRAAATIDRNIAAVGLPGASVRRGAVAAVLASRPPVRMDLVFADPPYWVDTGEVDGVLAALGRHGWVREGAIAVVERGAGSPPLSWPGGWSAWPPRTYGDTRLEFADAHTSLPACPRA
ncbi:16S rRNA (guanine(966)-N(2))-methyltransferase RsmD [Mycobacterium sp.]|uniref:16S rRNA (guanine(966)-N(2))-methyltransferase RsmD n=1 Tax=Mycobacterium sp. TaxID=1785 RepID=UPI003A8AA2CC